MRIVIYWDLLYSRVIRQTNYMGIGGTFLDLNKVSKSFLSKANFRTVLVKTKPNSKKALTRQSGSPGGFVWQQNGGGDKIYRYTLSL